MRMLLMVWPFMTIDATHVLRVNVILSGPFTDRQVALMEVVWSSLWVSLPADPDFGVCMASCDLSRFGLLLEGVL